MSRRRPEREDVDRTFVRVVVECRHHRGISLGWVVRQQGREMIGLPLQRLDGPDGETVVRARCQPCLAAGRGSDLQARWERMAALLDELAATGRHTDTLTI